MATGIEDLWVNRAALEPQPGIVLAGGAGGDPLLASAYVIAMSLDIDIRQDLCTGASCDGDHRRNENGADHEAELSMAEAEKRSARRGATSPARLFIDYLRDGSRGTTAIGTDSTSRPLLSSQA
jgi:hypothetical protein